MPTELKVVIAINTLATILIGALALLGGGFVAGNEPPARAIELQLVPVAAVPVGPRQARAHPAAHLGLPSGYGTPDPMAPRWRIADDGSVRFLPDGASSGPSSASQPQ